MQYVVFHTQAEKIEFFAIENEVDNTLDMTVTQQYLELMDYLRKKRGVSVLSVQNAYYIGLCLGRGYGFAWDDMGVDEQYLTLRRSI